MPHFELSENSVPVEDKQLTLEDASQPQLKELPEESRLEQQPSRPSQQRPWPLLVGIVFFIGTIGLGWHWWQTSRASTSSPITGGAGKPLAVAVKLATVETQTIRESSVSIGTLEAPRFVTIGSQIEGRINRIFIKEGDRVRQGQPIISLQSDDLQAILQQKKAALEQAQANLALLQAGTRPEQIAQARATLVQAQARLRDAQKGAQPQEIAQAVAQIESAKSELDLAKSRTKRYGQLRKEGAVSQDQFEGYLKQQRSNAAALAVAQKRLEQLRQTRSSDMSALSAAVEQQRQNLRQQENGPRPAEIAQARSQVNQAAAQVRSAQAQLRYTKVLAPFTGVVGNIPVKVGEYAGKGDRLTTLTKNDFFDLNLAIPLDRAQRLRLGLPVQLLDARGGSIAQGAVSFIAPNATPESQTVLAKATFANARGQMINHQSLPAKVIWDERPGILIPVTAVSRLAGKTFVFVAEEARSSESAMPTLTARQKPVVLGAIEGNNYQVIKGLQPGEKIIISGILNLTNGVPIVAAPADNANKTP